MDNKVFDLEPPTPDRKKNSNISSPKSNQVMNMTKEYSYQVV